MFEIINTIRKYIFWDGNPIDLGNPRTFQTDIIGRHVGNKLVKVLVGLRRAGKSYILRQIASKRISEGVQSENILYIKKEYMELAILRSAVELEELYKAYRQTLKPTGKVYILWTKSNILMSGSAL